MDNRGKSWPKKMNLRVLASQIRKHWMARSRGMATWMTRCSLRKLDSDIETNSNAIKARMKRMARASECSAMMKRLKAMSVDWANHIAPSLDWGCILK